MTDGDRRIAAVATGQLGAFSRRQAYDAGLSDRQLRSRVQSGFLVQTGPNAFRVSGAPTTLLSELLGLALDVGPPVWVCGATAAALHGFDGHVLRRPFHIVVPRARSLRRWNARVHRTDSMAPVDRCTIEGLDVTTPARTLIDLARTRSASELAASLDSALRDGLVSEDALHRRIVALRSQGRYGLPTLHEVLAGHEVSRGGHSWLEREFLRLLAHAGLPRPDMQPVLTKAGDRLVRVDCRFPGTNVVVELLGYQFHRTKRQMASDAKRMNALLAAGFVAYQFGYEHIVAEPGYVVATTTDALRRAAA